MKHCCAIWLRARRTVGMAGKPRLYIFTLCTLVFLSSCSLNPNVRKQRHFANGQRYFEKGDYRSAAVEFANATRIDPAYVDAHLRLADTYLRIQQTDRALVEFSLVIRLRPDDDQTRIKWTNLLIPRREFNEAREQTKLLLERRPDDPAVHSLASALFAAQGDTRAAIGEIEKTIELAPGNWVPYLTLALLEMNRGDFENVEIHLKKVIALDPQASQARVLLGTFYVSRKRFDQAEEEFCQAINIDAQSMEPREALAQMFLAEDKNAAAEQILIKAKQDLPTNPESILALSNLYFTTGNLSRAVAEYDVLFQAHQHDPQITKKYIQLLVLAKRYDAARRLTDGLLRSSPGDSDALLYRSQIQVGLGDISNAIQTLESVIKNAPNRSDAHYALGLAFEKQGDMERAGSEWQTALRLNPDMLDAHRSIANAAINSHDMHALQRAAMDIVRLRPRAAEGYALLALSDINLKQFDRAEDDVRKALEVGPQSASGYVQKGNLRLIEQRYSEAVEAYKAALDRNPNSTDALRGLTNAFVAAKQLDQAVATLNAQIEKSPTSSTFYGLLGDLLLHEKRDFNGAKAALEMATKLDPNNIAAWIELCQVRATKEGITRAIETDQQALKANPRQVRLHVLLGNLYESNSDWKNADAAYQMALTVDSNDPIAATSLARAMLHTGGNLDVALSLVQSARVALPQSPFVFDTMGWIYYSKGSYPLALNCLKQALGLQAAKHIPDNPDVHYHLGMTYEKMRQPWLARQHLEQVLRINPAYPDADQVKRELSGIRS